MAKKYVTRVLSDPELLCKMRPANLRRIVDAKRTYFEGYGLASDWDGAVDDEAAKAIALAIAAPGRQMTADLAETLCSIDLLSEPQYANELRERCEIAPPASGRWSRPDIATIAWFDHRNAAVLVLTKALLAHRRRFFNFRYTGGTGCGLRELADVDWGLLEERLRYVYSRTGRPAYAKVSAIAVSDEVWVVIRHGRDLVLDQGVRDDSPPGDDEVDGGAQASAQAGDSGTASPSPDDDPSIFPVAYHPVHYDLAVFFDGGTSVRLNVEREGAVDGLLHHFQDHLYASRIGTWTPRSYTLTPLLEDLQRATSAEGHSDILDVQLDQVLYREGALIKSMQAASGSLCAQFRYRPLPRVDLMEAKFNIKFVSSYDDAPTRTRTLKVTAGNITEYTRDQDAGILEAWLVSREYVSGARS